MQQVSRCSGLFFDLRLLWYYRCLLWDLTDQPSVRVTVAVGATSNVSVVPVPGSTSLPKSGVVNLNPQAAQT